MTMRVRRALLDRLAEAEQQRDEWNAKAAAVVDELYGVEGERDDALAKIERVEALCDADDQRRVPGALHVSRVNAEEIRAALTGPHRGSAE